jgi:hypothetical protein
MIKSTEDGWIVVVVVEIDKRLAVDEDCSLTLCAFNLCPTLRLCLVTNASFFT